MWNEHREFLIAWDIQIPTQNTAFRWVPAISDILGLVTDTRRMHKKYILLKTSLTTLVSLRNE